LFGASLFSTVCAKLNLKKREQFYSLLRRFCNRYFSRGSNLPRFALNVIVRRFNWKYFGYFKPCTKWTLKFSVWEKHLSCGIQLSVHSSSGPVPIRIVPLEISYTRRSIVRCFIYCIPVFAFYGVIMYIYVWVNTSAWVGLPTKSKVKLSRRDVLYYLPHRGVKTFYAKCLNRSRRCTAR